MQGPIGSACGLVTRFLQGGRRRGGHDVFKPEKFLLDVYRDSLDLKTTEWIILRTPVLKKNI